MQARTRPPNRPNPIRGWNENSDDERSIGSPTLEELRPRHQSRDQLSPDHNARESSHSPKHKKELKWLSAEEGHRHREEECSSPGSYDEESIASSSPTGTVDHETMQIQSPQLNAEEWAFWNAKRRASMASSEHSAENVRSPGSPKAKEKDTGTPITTTQHMIKYLNERLPRNWTPGSLTKTHVSRWLDDNSPDVPSPSGSSGSAPVTPTSAARKQFFKSARQKLSEKSILPPTPTFREGPARSPGEFDVVNYGHSHIPVFSARAGSERGDMPALSNPTPGRMSTTDLETSMRGLDRMWEKVTKREEVGLSDIELMQQRWSSPKAFRHRPPSVSVDDDPSASDAALSPWHRSVDIAQRRSDASPQLRPHSSCTEPRRDSSPPLAIRNVHSAPLDDSPREALQSVMEQESAGREWSKESEEAQDVLGEDLMMSRVELPCAASRPAQPQHYFMTIDGLVRGEGVDIRAGLVDIFRSFGVMSKDMVIFPSQRDTRHVSAHVRFYSEVAFDGAFESGLELGMRVSRSSLALLCSDPNQTPPPPSPARPLALFSSPSASQAPAVPKLDLHQPPPSSPPLQPSSPSSAGMRSARNSAALLEKEAAGSRALAANARREQWNAGGGARLDTTPSYRPISAFAAGRVAGPKQLCSPRGIQGDSSAGTDEGVWCYQLLTAAPPRAKPTVNAIAPKRVDPRTRAPPKSRFGVTRPEFEKPELNVQAESEGRAAGVLSAEEEGAEMEAPPEEKEHEGEKALATLSLALRARRALRQPLLRHEAADPEHEHAEAEHPDNGEDDDRDPDRDYRDRDRDQDRDGARDRDRNRDGDRDREGGRGRGVGEEQAGKSRPKSASALRAPASPSHCDSRRVQLQAGGERARARHPAAHTPLEGTHRTPSRPSTARSLSDTRLATPSSPTGTLSRAWSRASSSRPLSGRSLPASRPSSARVSGSLASTLGSSYGLDPSLSQVPGSLASFVGSSSARNAPDPGPGRVRYVDQVAIGGYSERRATRAAVLWPYWHHALGLAGNPDDLSPLGSERNAALREQATKAKEWKEVRAGGAGSGSSLSRGDAQAVTTPRRRKGLSLG